MPEHHVIIGGGPVATNAIETIREFDNGESRITLISDEPAHSRMALPYWLSGQFPREHTYTGDDAYFRDLGVETRIGERVTAVDPKGKAVTLSDGSTLPFDTLLIGTGARPAGLPVPGADLAGVQPLWTLDHTQSLLDAAGAKPSPPAPLPQGEGSGVRVCMIGAGFIGFIMLNAMHKRGWQLAVVERESHVLPRMLDDDGAKLVESWLHSQGVKLHCGTTVQEIREADDGSKVVALEDGTEVSADVVVIATGIKPNVEFLDGSGVQIDDGILVDDRMQTNFPHVFAGGDVAQGPVLFSDEPQIHAIQPTAVDHGRVAGANMAGQEVHYPGSLLMNVLDACGLQCASFGNWSDPQAEPMTIANPDGHVYRKLLWQDDEIVGAIFLGRANDMGMLTDVGMVKGILQTRTPMGAWKEYLRENPFDIRRPYVANNVADKLTKTTLLGRPSKPRGFRSGGVQPKTNVHPAHAAYVGTKES